jgi:hypothetical protein
MQALLNESLRLVGKDEEMKETPDDKAMRLLQTIPDIASDLGESYAEVMRSLYREDGQEGKIQLTLVIKPKKQDGFNFCEIVGEVKSNVKRDRRRRISGIVNSECAVEFSKGRKV